MPCQCASREGPSIMTGGAPPNSHSGIGNEAHPNPACDRANVDEGVDSSPDDGRCTGFTLDVRCQVVLRDGVAETLRPQVDKETGFSVGVAATCDGQRARLTGISRCRRIDFRNEVEVEAVWLVQCTSSGPILSL